MKILSCGAGMQSTALALMACANKLIRDKRIEAEKFEFKYTEKSTNLRRYIILRSRVRTRLGIFAGIFHTTSLRMGRNTVLYFRKQSI